MENIQIYLHIQSQCNTFTVIACFVDDGVGAKRKDALSCPGRGGGVLRINSVKSTNILRMAAREV